MLNVLLNTFVAKLIVKYIVLLIFEIYGSITKSPFSPFFNLGALKYSIKTLLQNINFKSQTIYP